MPNTSPPVAHPIRKMDVERVAHSLTRSGSANAPPLRSVSDITRARLNNCWSRQSAIHAIAATQKTNHWYLLRSRREAQPARGGAGEAVDIGSVRVWRAGRARGVGGGPARYTRA